LRRKKEMRIYLTLVLAAACFMAQCSSTKTKSQSDEQKMKEKVLEMIPIGSNLRDAQRSMEDSGFRCSKYKAASFVEYLNDNTQKVHEREDFLWCAKSEPIAPLTTLDWQVILVVHGEAVYEVYVSSGVTAP
jgi:hypothetical protein